MFLESERVRSEFDAQRRRAMAIQAAAEKEAKLSQLQPQSAKPRKIQKKVVIAVLSLTHR
jgi:hypothetical protein